MHLVFADSPNPESVEQTLFLAGPSPRHSGMGNNWRQEAVQFLMEAGYEGHVIIPMTEAQFREDKFEELETTDERYLQQIQFEKRWMRSADVILMWMCRSFDFMGLTSNIEFGEYLESGRLLYGRPDGAINTRYLDYRVGILGGTVYPTLEKLISGGLTRVRKSAVRVDAEIWVPLCIWNSPQFTKWYENLLKSGNHFAGFETKMIIGNCTNNEVFGYVARPTISIPKERHRTKDNELVFSRTNLTAVVCYYDTDERREYLLVREMRPAVNNREGYIYEFPSGTSKAEDDPRLTAVKELKEETGITIIESERDRLVELGSRQTFSSFTSCLVNAYALQLNSNEYEEVKARCKFQQVQGENEEEQITLHLVTAAELLQHPVDLITVGLTALLPAHKG